MQPVDRRFVDRELLHYNCLISIGQHQNWRKNTLSFLEPTADASDVVSIFYKIGLSLDRRSGNINRKPEPEEKFPGEESGGGEEGSPATREAFKNLFPMFSAVNSVLVLVNFQSTETTNFHRSTNCRLSTLPADPRKRRSTHRRSTK